MRILGCFREEYITTTIQPIRRGLTQPATTKITKIFTKNINNKEEFPNQSIGRRLVNRSMSRVPLPRLPLEDRSHGQHGQKIYLSLTPTTTVFRSLALCYVQFCVS